MGRFRQGIARFMQGRYGVDKLNLVFLYSGLGVCILGMFFRQPRVSLTLTLLSYALMGIAIFRCFSRNTYKRYRENRRFLLFFQRIRDRQHRYFDCPRCHQEVRVPRGKGKIAIHCPKCRETFIKKT